MIFLRVFLYLTCIISLSWSVLVFGGPPVIKKIVSAYSDGTLTPFGITVSPRLDIGISRLEFNFQKDLVGRHIEGFSRSTEITWSFFSQKPFLEIKIGPSVLKDYGTVDSINFYTPSFQNIDFQNIDVVANIEGVAVKSAAKMRSVTIDGNVNLTSSKILDVNIEAKEVDFADGVSHYSAKLLRSEVAEITFNAHFSEQLLSSTYLIEDIIVLKPNFTVPQAVMEIEVTDDAKNIKIDLHDVEFSEFNGYIENLKVDGSFNHLNLLQDLRIVSIDGVFSPKLPRFPRVSAKVKNLGNEQFKVLLEGETDKFELFDSKNYVGLLPRASFVIDSELDRFGSKLTSKSKINFNVLSAADINATVELGFISKFLTTFGCEFLDCDLSDFEFSYVINIDDEWVKGSAYCPIKFCGISDIEHFVSTSNTVNIFTILNKTNMLNPVSSLYLYGAITSGQKINDGHELKFQF